MGTVLAVAVLAGCTHSHTIVDHGPPPTQLNAEWVCRTYTPGPHVSAEATTVGDFRTTTIGTVGPTQRHRFPDLPATAAAAWCWSGKPDAYSVYEVTGGGQVERVVASINGVPASEAHGAPAVP